MGCGGLLVKYFMLQSWLRVGPETGREPLPVSPAAAYRAITPPIPYWPASLLNAGTSVRSSASYRAR